MEFLHQLRANLLALHGALIAAERGRFEGEHGPTTAGGFLQALMSDPSLAWLKPLTRLVLEFDEVLDTKPAPGAPELDAALSKIRGLLTPDESAHSFGREYSRVLSSTPDASLAHAALMQDLAKGRR